MHRQAWPDWWTDGFGSAARETAAARATHVAVDADQTLLAMASLLGGQLPRSVVRSNGGHSRGSALLRRTHVRSGREHQRSDGGELDGPMGGEVGVCLGGGQAGGAAPRRGARRSSAVSPARLRRDDRRFQYARLAAFRPGRVFIDHEILPSNKAFRIVDPETGQAISAQPMASRSEGTWWALWASDVPALGYKSYRIEVANEERAALPASDPHVLENKFYRLTADPATGGLASIVDKQTGSELVDPEADWDAGQLLRETLAGGRDFRPGRVSTQGAGGHQTPSGRRGTDLEELRGPRRTRRVRQANGAMVEVRLYEPEKRIELHYAIRKLPLTRPEAVYVAFPFAGLRPNRLRSTGRYRPSGPGPDPRSASDWQTVQSFLAVRSEPGQIVWGSDQAPLVQLGDFNLGKWQPVTQIDRPHVYSWVMNNYWFTNFRATQEGEFKWSYYLTSTADTFEYGSDSIWMVFARPADSPGSAPGQANRGRS